MVLHTDYEEVTSGKWRPVRRLIFLLTYLLTSYIFYSQYEGWSFFEITYFIVITVSTLGYSAPKPTDNNSRLFTIFFIFVGVAIIFTVLTTNANRSIRALERLCCKKKRTKNHYQIDDLHHKKTVYLAVLYIFLVLTVGAIVFNALEGWSWIECFYFAVQIATTVGYGDLLTSHNTHIFLIFYIIVSIVMFAYAINSVGSVVEHERLLKARRLKLKQMQSLDFIAELNEGKGVAKHEFVLAILTHLGVLNAENDVEPWMKKFEEFDTNNCGVLTKAELQNFFAQEAEESQQQLQQMADRQKVSVLGEMIEESRMSIMETVIPFSRGAAGGGDIEEGRGSFSLSLFRGSQSIFRSASTNSTGPVGGPNGRNISSSSSSSSSDGTRSTIVNPISRGIRAPIKRGSTTATYESEAGQSSSGGSRIADSNSSCGTIELEDMKNNS